MVFTVATKPSSEARLDAVVNLCKRRGFVYPCGEIYGGTRSAWDYGPLGVELKENVKRQWWRAMVTRREDVVGLDSSVILPRQVWEASGHVNAFVDPLVECQSCHRRYRADQLEEEFVERKGRAPEGGLAGIPCPNCGTRGAWTEPRMFNGLLKTYLGPVEDESGLHFLRPETAQGIFVNYKNVEQSARKKPPFGIGQIGKSFRNEITPGNFIFRVREFEQMELEFFCKPGEDLEWFDYWRAFCREWLLSLGMKAENLRLRDHEKDKLAFYSKATTDFEYLFPFGWGELWGVADRTDYDLKQHQEHSGKSMEYLDPVTNEKFIPYCVEPSVGVDRLVLAFLCDAYDEEELEGGDVRTVLHLHPALAPFKAAVLPLQKNKLGDKAREVYRMLSKRFMVEYDETGSIGKRYRRQDEVGTPLCATIDFDTLETGNVTVRDRDTMKQDIVAIDNLVRYIEEKTDF